MRDSDIDTMIVPPGRVKGLLPRESRVGEYAPLLSTRITPLTDRELQELTGEVSLKPFVHTILDQGRAGSCAAEATTQAVMIGRAVAGQEHVVLNPYGLYAYSSGGRDVGSALDANLRFARDTGIPPMDVWPRNLGPLRKPTGEAAEAAKQFRIDEFYEIGSLREMQTALCLGFPVVYGANGHAVCKVEHTTRDYGLDVNSWGDDWGQGGFGVWASYARIHWGYGCFAVRTTTWRPAIPGYWRGE